MMDSGLLTQISVFSFVLLRMSGMILVNPLIGRRTFPNLFKAGMVFVFSVMIFSYTEIDLVPPTVFPEYVLMLLKEFLCGVTMGVVVNIYIFVISFAGEQIDMQMGLSMSAMYDPGSNISQSISGTFYNIAFVIIFFSTNCHLTMIRLFLDSAQLVPYGEVAINTGLTDVMIDMFCQCTVLGLKMAMPLVFMEILLEVAVGTMMKAVPQIDIFVVNIQLKMMLGVILLFVVFQPMSDFIEYVAASIFGSMTTALQAMA